MKYFFFILFLTCFILVACNSKPQNAGQINKYTHGAKSLLQSIFLAGIDWKKTPSIEIPDSIECNKSMPSKGNDYCISAMEALSKDNIIQFSISLPNSNNTDYITKYYKGNFVQITDIQPYYLISRFTSRYRLYEEWLVHAKIDSVPTDRVCLLLDMHYDSPQKWGIIQSFSVLPDSVGIPRYFYSSRYDSRYTDFFKLYIVGGKNTYPLKIINLPKIRLSVDVSTG